MMKNISMYFFFTCLCMFSLLHVPLIPAAQFHSDKYGYQLDLPKGWIQIPDKILQETFAILLEQGADSSIMFDVGFQLDTANDWLEYPYVIVQTMSYSKLNLNRQINEDDFPDFVKMLTGVDIRKHIEKSEYSKVNQLIENYDAERPILDTKKRRYIWLMNMNIVSVGPIRCFSVGYFGRESLVQVLFYCRPINWDRYAKERQAITDSFRFDPDKAYSTELAAASKSSRHSVWWQGVVEKSIGSLIMCGVLAVIIGVFATINRKRT